MVSEDTYGALVLAFDTDAPEFARGVEVGRIWERLSLEPEPLVQTIHASNAEMMLRIAEATGRSVSAEIHDEVFATVEFGPGEEDSC
jgi:hypothetical protein